MDLTFVSIPIISLFCWLIGQFIKTLDLDEKITPVICGFCGIPLGILAMYVAPDFPADNFMTAAAIGIVSGLSATGGHQVYKQLGK